MDEDETLRWLQDEYDAISTKEFWARVSGETGPHPAPDHIEIRQGCQQTDPLAGADDARAHAALHAREVASRNPDRAS